MDDKVTKVTINLDRQSPIIPSIIELHKDIDADPTAHDENYFGWFKNENLLTNCDLYFSESIQICLHSELVFVSSLLSVYIGPFLGSHKFKGEK